MAGQNLSSYHPAQYASLYPPVNTVPPHAYSSDNVPAPGLSLPALASCFALLLWVLLHHYRARNNTPLCTVPGPWFASCSILYRFYFAVVCGSWHRKSIALHKQYGPMVRISPTEVSVADPTVIPTMYAHVEGAYPKCEM